MQIQSYNIYFLSWVTTFLLLHYKNVLKMARIKRKVSHFPEKKCLSEDSCHYYLYLIEYMQDSVLYLVVGSVVTEVPGDE